MAWMASGTKEERVELNHLSEGARPRAFIFFLIRGIYLLAAILLGLAFYWKVFLDRILSFGGVIGAVALLLFCISCILAAFRKNKSSEDISQ